MALERHAQDDHNHTRPLLGSVAVVGAGISGLAAAYRLKKEGVAVTIFEAEDTAGGKIKSFHEDGFIWEKGPNTMVESDLEVSNVIDGLQLRHKQQYPILQSKRYIVRNGRPELLPSNPLAFLGSKLLSVPAKLCIIFEPFLWRHKKSNDGKLDERERDESVGDFLERHVGREVVDYIVDPFVAGTSGSDPDSLSMRHSFPTVWELEKRYGSLLFGAIRATLDSRKKKKTGTKKPTKGSFSFVGGMQTFTDALAGYIGQENIKYNATVLSLACDQQGNPLRDSWKVSYLDASHGNEHDAELKFDAVIMTAPLSNFAKMHICQEGKPYSLEFIPKVIYQPLSVLVMAFKRDEVNRALNGFGVLIPSKEQKNGFQTLGTIFSSAMFPDRAPPETVLFTSFIGGSRNKNLAYNPSMELKEAVMGDLHRLVGISGQPIFFKHIFWSKAFPQYGQGYDDVLNALKKLEGDLPGFYYAGNHRGGLAVGRSLVSGYNIAGEVVEYLQTSGGRKLYTMASANMQMQE